MKPISKRGIGFKKANNKWFLIYDGIARRSLKYRVHDKDTLNSINLYATHNCTEYNVWVLDEKEGLEAMMEDL